MVTRPRLGPLILACRVPRASGGHKPKHIFGIVLLAQPHPPARDAHLTCNSQGCCAAFGGLGEQLDAGFVKADEALVMKAYLFGLMLECNRPFSGPLGRYRWCIGCRDRFGELRLTAGR